MLDLFARGHGPDTALDTSARAGAASTLTRTAVLLVVPALALGLLSPGLAAHATGTGTFYAAQNTPTGATVSGPASTTHRLADRLSSVAADGSAHVLAAVVSSTRTATVLVDGVSGAARIVAVDPALRTYAGNGAVVARSDSGFALLDVATGASTPLVGFPAASGTTRTVTAVAAVAGGAVVATADVTASGSSGAVRSARLWKLTTGAPQQLAELGGAHIPAVAATGGAVDALLVAVADDSLAHLHVAPDGTTTRTALDAPLASDTTAAEIGYADDGTGLSPVVVMTGGSGVRVLDLAGTTLRTFAEGSRVFLSARDLQDPTSVANPLTTVARLTGVPDGRTLRFGTRVTPVASATASGVVAAGPVAVTLAMRRGRTTTAGTSRRSIALTANTCFTAASRGTTYRTTAAPVVDCVEVEHRLELRSFERRHRRAVVATSADRLSVQVKRGRRWVTVARVSVGRTDLARFTAPRGAVRVVAAASASNAGAVLQVSSR
ncbi:MAG: hypothetical protein WB441_06820 [Nocardioidaceae bacterium]